MFGFSPKKARPNFQYRDNYYHDDPQNEYFARYGKTLSGLSRTFAYTVLFAVSVMFIQSTVAANINLNSQKIVEFGQGSTGDWIGQWVMMAGTYDGTTAKLYVNGQLVTTQTISWNTVQNTNQIGRQTNGSEYTNGRISYISYYNKVLSADEMAQNFNAIRGRYGI